VLCQDSNRLQPVGIYGAPTGSVPVVDFAPTGSVPVVDVPVVDFAPTGSVPVVDFAPTGSVPVVDFYSIAGKGDRNHLFLTS